MRKREFKTFINEIINMAEVIEYTDDGEEGNIYIDRFAKLFVKEYNARVSKEKMKDLLSYMKKLMK